MNFEGAPGALEVPRRPLGRDLPQPLRSRQMPAARWPLIRLVRTEPAHGRLRFEHVPELLRDARLDHLLGRDLDRRAIRRERTTEVPREGPTPRRRMRGTRTVEGPVSRRPGNGDCRKGTAGADPQWPVHVCRTRLSGTVIIRQDSVIQAAWRRFQPLRRSLPRGRPRAGYSATGSVPAVRRPAVGSTPPGNTSRPVASMTLPAPAAVPPNVSSLRPLVARQLRCAPSPSPTTRHSPLPCGSGRQAVRFGRNPKDRFGIVHDVGPAAV